MFRKILALYSALFLALVSMVAMPPAQAVDTCVGTSCEVTFGYTGAAQSWTVPKAAKNITFDVQGAAGGRFGGLGGRVTGTLSELPGTLFIYVGGAGTMGTDAAGGFNGGGRSGGQRSNEGSGGGASDIRISGSLESRIVVAGGGGGTGGYSGGLGGHGGNLVATDGASGQGGGGKGGTQISGGLAGSNNGGLSPASAGTFGQGGSGGFSLNAGGGGGGGGWYGGGGGGGDDDDCCGDGGGGGGGSSYASSTHTQDVSHTAGVRQGAGVVIIRYELSAELVGFFGTQYSTDGASFELEYNSDISELTESDLVLTGAGCQLVSLTISSSKAFADVQGCLSDPTLELIPNSFQVIGNQPANTLSAQVVFDRTPPAMAVSKNIFSSSQAVFEVFIADAVNHVSTHSFSVAGCQAADIGTYSPMVLTVSNCVGPTAEISLAQGALIDQFGNASDTISQTLFFDLVAAELEWLTPQISYGDTIDFQLALTASEPVTLSADAFSWSPVTLGCIADFSKPLLLSFTGCRAGQLEVTLLPNSVLDAVGHRSPTLPLSTLVKLAWPAVAINDVPVSQEATTPSPTEAVVDLPTPESETSAEITDGSESAEPVAEPDFQQVFVQPRDLKPTPVTTSPTTEVSEESYQEPALDSGEADLTEIDSKVELVSSEAVAPSNNDWFLAIAAVVALLAIGGIGSYVFRLAENNRSRTIE